MLPEMLVDVISSVPVAWVTDTAGESVKLRPATVKLIWPAREEKLKLPVKTWPRAVRVSVSDRPTMAKPLELKVTEPEPEKLKAEEVTAILPLTEPEMAEFW